MSDIEKHARKHGVYEYLPGDELNGTILITYRGDGSGLRVWFSDLELQEQLKDEIMGKAQL